MEYDKKLKRNAGLWSLLLLAVLWAAGFACDSSNVSPREGDYRGVFVLGDKSEIPFNFTFQKTPVAYELTLINGNDRFAITGQETPEGELLFDIDLLDNQLVVTEVVEGGLKGHLRRSSGEDRIPFEAKHGERYRFSVPSSEASATNNVSGSWDVALSRAGNPLNGGVGVFTQKGSEVEGTIMTKTGDMRHLQGNVVGDSLYLSAFAGSFPLLIKVSLSEGEKFEGKIVRFTGETDITGLFNPDAELEDPYSLTLSKQPTIPAALEFPDLDGNPVSLDDPIFQDKVIVLNIMGSWCPNCMDEAGFLSPWYEENKSRGVEIIALSFERQDDLSYAKGRLGSFIRRFDVTYPVLFGGKTDKETISKKLPFIDGVQAFPTTIFIGKDRQIKKIHTGFSGPATGVHYEEYKKSFNDTIDALLAEK